MANLQFHDAATSNVLAWTSQQGHMQHSTDDDAVTDQDEPPEAPVNRGNSRDQFKKNAVPKTVDHSESLLTKALVQSVEDADKSHYGVPSNRRRSLLSSVSLASTADLTSDTGFTSPARTNTPSPPPPVFSLARLNEGMFNAKSKPAVARERPNTTHSTKETSDVAVEALAKKRCISFACGLKTEPMKSADKPQPVDPKPAEEEKARRKPCIKFACVAKPPVQSDAPQRPAKAGTALETLVKQKPSSPTLARKYRSPSAGRGRQHRSVTPRPSSHIRTAPQNPKYLSPDADDLSTESARFHEFASDEPREDDWIRQNPPSNTRLTIDDTLRKENEIRRLGKEAEEEALEEQEEEEEEEQDLNDIDVDVDGDDADSLDSGSDDADNDEDDADETYDHSGYTSNDDDAASDGYNTDNEIGFADSDDEDDADLQLWTPSKGLALKLSSDTPTSRRRSSIADGLDSSVSSDADTNVQRVRKTRSIVIRPGTPELPDSTDFVCGTLDEDRALEDAYISCVAARRREKLHVIPQDIDPSFPTSEPEDEDVEPSRHGHDSDEQLWIHGELEDLHHVADQDSERRRRKSGQVSPKRYRSPPPKCRGRSPRRLFDRHSPRRFVSPPPAGRPVKSPPASLVRDGHGGGFKTLAFRPGLTHTKSLPRPSAIFPHHIKGSRRNERAVDPNGHVRGAIDIVKGLEQKRQRRKDKFKEKYLQKHNKAARKGQLPQPRPLPGKGAERMREIGLLSAGKQGLDQYVLSV